MLQLTIPAGELWDELKEEFVYSKGQTLMLEHSLVSLSKWESKWCKPFLTKQPKSYEETLDYIKCMTITQNVQPETYNCLSDIHIEQIRQYIEAPMTATRISKRQNGTINNEQITAELVYYWMIALNIPVEFQKWHLNKLITLIEICNIKNQPNKKISYKESIAQQAALNEARRKQLNSKG